MSDLELFELGRWVSFKEGARATLPVMLGVVPFGLICGAVCVASGMTEWGAIGLSVMIFAGASQIVAAQLLAEEGMVGVAIVAALAINLRMMMYSASLLPHFHKERFSMRALFAYLLTDQAFATSINRFSEKDAVSVHRPMYYLGAGIAMWISFNLSTALGAYVGPFIPSELGLEFAIPLTFIALVVPRVSDRPSLIAALAAGGIAYAFDWLPLNLGLLVAAFGGIALGWMATLRKGARCD
ncbi:AzlC family ABC transporter permease [Pelagicoccus mobilis]|uniref:AzlC family ABC transporter permease n=1 Tax=Pelagicoccus mobilis TaxID=415221 RepID=A0A934VKQ0_9BACT|nr:AzlC family ABC transporter permease [Pelagicoccus mobilis]MBK1876921.1 AzlC family ABC transporter permease [Pelagicoccus mobilis]